MISPPSPQDTKARALGSEMEEWAALYALGLLTEEQSLALETLMLGGCEHLREAVRDAEAAVSAYVLAAPSAPPPAGARQRLLQSLRPRSAAPFLVRRRADLAWEATSHAGVTKQLLFSDAITGLNTILVRMEPGARIEPHAHARAEQCLILEGDAEWDGARFGPGDFLVGLPHEKLPEFSTRHGNLLLIVGSSEGSPFFHSAGI